MRAVHNFADRSADRPSLLIRYMAAIGGGVCICRGGPFDLRYDGVSIEILRSRLEHYAFLPVPNSHYAVDDQDKICELSTLLQQKQLGQAQASFEFYRTHNPIGAQRIREWAQDIKNQRSLEPYDQCVLKNYQISQTTPLIILGSCEGYQGWPKLTKEIQTQTPEHPTELFRILDDCGYARRFRLVGPEDEQYMGVHDFQHEHRYWPINPPDRKRDYADAGLIYLSRTPQGRTVLLIAGASHPYGTYAGLRVCMDHGRTELNHQVEQFINGKTRCVAIPYRCGPQIPGEDHDLIYSKLPVHAELYVDKPTDSYAELSIRELEVRLAALQPPPTALLDNTSVLTKFLREEKGLSALTKAYPVDQRDDSTSKDLVESLLPHTQFYAVSANLPWNVNGSLGLPANFESQLNEFLDKSDRKENVTTESESLLQALVRIERSGRDRLEQWKSFLTMRRDKKHFAKWVERQYHFPSSHLLVLGSPESFLGFVSATEAVDFENDPLPQLATLMKNIGYPNRFVLRGGIGNESLIEDRKSMQSLNVPCAPQDKYNADVGLIYLKRGTEGQIVCIVAGNNWLGTLGGVQLLFAERRPLVDAAVQEFLDNRRDHLEIAFGCRRIEPNGRVSDFKGQNSEAMHKGSEPKGSNETEVEEFLPSSVSVSHPSVELEVKLLGDDPLEMFHWSSEAEFRFRKLWPAMDTKEKPIEEIKIGEDTNINVTFASDGCIKRLNIHCKSRLEILDDAVNHVIFCSDPTAKTFDSLYRACSKSRGECNQDIQKTPPRHRCYPFLIVGPTGVGKEGAARFMASQLNPQGHFARFNMTEFNEETVISELFGTYPGAFPGAEDLPGIFQVCGDQGVLVLDEGLAGNPQLQSKVQPMLLRVLETGVVRRMAGRGADRPPNCINTYFIMTTNEAETLEKLRQAVAARHVRSDLIGRIQNRFEFPSIANRPLEILPSFVWALLQSTVRTMGEERRLKVRMTRDAIFVLVHCSFPENFRQLNAVAERIANSEEFRTEQLITKRLVIAALSNHTHQNERSTSGDDRQNVIEVCLTWEDLIFEQPALAWPAFHQLELTHPKWPKSAGDAKNDYLDLLNKIVLNLTNKDKGKYGPKLRAFTTRRYDVDDLRSIVEIIYNYLNGLQDSALDKCFDKWLSWVGEGLRETFPYDPILAEQIWKMDSVPDAQRKRILVWLLTGVVVEMRS